MNEVLYPIQPGSYSPAEKMNGFGRPIPNGPGKLNPGGNPSVSPPGKEFGGKGPPPDV